MWYKRRSYGIREGNKIWYKRKRFMYHLANDTCRQRNNVSFLHTIQSGSLTTKRHKHAPLCCREYRAGKIALTRWRNL